MNKWIRPAVLAAVFLVTLVIGALVMNKSNTDFTSSLEEPTLPVVYFLYNDIKINELHGYTSEMDVCSMRDTITPVGEDRYLHTQIETYGTGVNDLHYQIRSIDGQRLVAEGEITNYRQNGSRIYYDIQAENILETNEEYIYCLSIEMDEQTAYYYTRIERTSERSVDECLAFAHKFHNYTLNGEATSFIPTYMDPATGDATTLNYVDLSCTLRQITWAKFEGQVITDIIADIKEITSSYNVIVLKYVMISQNEAGETEYYNIEEYYRLRNTETRMYVLNFERTMTQIFSGENTILSDLGNLQLGIRDMQVECKSNDAGEVVAFVQEGELWCYNSNENSISRVFSFRSLEGLDTRSDWNNHSIKIMSVDEAGSVDFVVYGYMNRGKHEGQVGVSVCHYDGLAHTVEEEAFIPSDKSFEVLKAELGNLLYVNELDQLFMIISGDLYRIELIEKTSAVLVSGLTTNTYAVSDSGRYLAYIDSDKVNNANEIVFLDLKNGMEQKLTETGGNFLRPLGFIDEDFVYGIAKIEDIRTDTAGNIFFAMSSLKIVENSETDLTVLKEYKPSQGYIFDVDIKDYVIKVIIQTLSDGRFVAAPSDSIMNRNADSEENVLIDKTVTEIKETQVQLVLKNVKKKDAKMTTASFVVANDDRTFALETSEKGEHFYVYAKGRVVMQTDNVTDAIKVASDACGAVVDQNQHYVWNRAKEAYVNAFGGLSVYQTDKNAGSIASCVSAMLVREDYGIAVSDLMKTGNSVFDVLSKTLKDYVVLDVSGCTLDQVLYYVNEGNPVFAMTDSNSAVLLVGYTSKVVYCYDPALQKVVSLSYADAENRFAKASNIFITYIK